MQHTAEAARWEELQEGTDVAAELEEQDRESESS
jgi:hypothetical protein